MMLRSSLLSMMAFCCLLFSSRAEQVTKKSRPNIFLLLTDDQDVLLGSLEEMPFLNNYLKRQGTTFENAFVHTPICCPSRSSILSGRYLHNGGARNNSISGNCYGTEWINDAEQDTFAVHAQKAGYQTSYAGKYLNAYGVVGSPGCKNNTDQGCNRVPPGWTKWLGLVGNSVYYNYSMVQSDNGGQTSRRIRHKDAYQDDYMPDVVANQSLAMIQEFVSQENRFLIVNSWPTPHAPFTPAPWAEHMFEGKQAPRTRNWNASRAKMQQKHWLMRQFAPLDNGTVDRIDTTYKRRLEALLSIDNHVQQIVTLLKETNQLDNTYIIYTSDNGFQFGQHRVPSDKRLLYEHDLRIPFIVAGPGIPKNHVENQQMVLNIDIAPTIIGMVTGNHTAPAKMDGSSFLPYLKSLNNNEAGSIAVGRDPFQLRQDFLVAYHGEGFAPCDLWSCPPPPPNEWHYEGDSRNNTYYCVRTIRSASVSEPKRDDIYCRFDDDENFCEYYNHIDDPWQLKNKCKDLTSTERDRLERRLAQLKSCQGNTCRLPPSIGTSTTMIVA